MRVTIPGMKRPLVAAVVLGLVAVPGAAAKPDLTVIRLCGPSACVETRDERVRETLRRLLSPPAYTYAVPPALGPYYVLTGGEDREPYGVFVPGRTSMRWNWVGAAPAWVDAGADVRAEFERLAEGVQPYKPPRPVRAVVNGRLVKNPGRFTSLFGELQPRGRPRAAGPRWIPVTVIWNRANPWTDASSMFYDPDDRALFRGGAWFRVPAQLARMITRR